MIIMNRLNDSQEYDSVSWYTKIGRLKRAYESLTDLDLNYTQGQKESMIEAFMAKLSISKKEIVAVMDKVRPLRWYELDSWLIYFMIEVKRVSDWMMLVWASKFILNSDRHRY